MKKRKKFKRRKIPKRRNRRKTRRYGGDSVFRGLPDYGDPYVPSMFDEPDVIDSLFPGIFPDFEPVNSYQSPAQFKSNYLFDMKKFAAQRGKPVQFAPYDSTPVDYRSMDPSQFKYYLYWRDRAREGEYLIASFNYAKLYLGELINKVNITASEARRRLESLWVAINGDLGFVLTDTGEKCIAREIFDFYYFNNQDLTQISPDIIKSVRSSDRFAIGLNHMSRRKPLKLPFDYIMALSDYDYENKSLIYKQSPGLYKETIENVFYVLDFEKRRKDGKGILESLKRQRMHFEMDAFPVSIADPKLYKLDNLRTRYRPEYVKNFFTGVIYHTENVLRGYYHLRGRYSKYRLDDTDRKILEDFLKTYDPSVTGKFEAAENYITRVTEGKRIKLDSERLEELQLETETVKEILNTEETETKEDPMIYLEGLQYTLSSLVKSDSNYAGAFKELVSGDEIQVDRDFVNRTALRFLNSPLLTEDSKINERFLPALEYIYDNIEAYPFLNIGDDEITSFYDNLTPEYQKILKIIAHEKDPDQAVMQEAMTMLTMPDLLYDEINDQALLYLDDIVIETGDGVQIVEEYREALKRITEEEDE